MRELGFRLDDTHEAEIVRGKDFVQVKNGPFDLDMVFAPDGIETFAEAWGRRVEVEGFPVCHLDDIIASKAATNRVRIASPYRGSGLFVSTGCAAKADLIRRWPGWHIAGLRPRANSRNSRNAGIGRISGLSPRPERSGAGGAAARAPVAERVQEDRRARARHGRVEDVEGVSILRDGEEAYRSISVSKWLG